uniref:G_PROTEIN_RECEP_F1_2 domain-containing protein n=1 Tax=Echinostoma caproni TaxID=27848 RepID=A0A183AEJ1_9TREM
LIPSYSTVSADMLQVCEFRKPFRDNGLRGVWIWVDATLYSYLPFILITIFNVIILINLHEANRRRVTLAAHWSQNARTPQTQPSLLMRGWLSISSLCPCHQREHELPRRRVCQFCAQSFPIDRFHESPGLLPNANRVCVSATYSNSPFLLHTLSQPISQERWPARAYTPAVNIKFGACHLNGYEIKTVNVERRSRPAVTSEVRQLTVLLLLISGTFLITTAPVVIVKLVIGRLDDRSASRLVQIELLDYIAEILMYINHAANFYLYLVAGPRFRREIRKLFHMRRYLRPHGRAGFGRPRRQKPKRYF